MGGICAGEVVRVDCGRVVPADCLILATEGNATANIDTSGLDGETNLKPRGAYGLIPRAGTVIRCGESYPQLNQLDATVCVPGEEEWNAPAPALLPRGSIVRTPGWVAAVVCYTGKDTKILLGTTSPEPKVSRIGHLMNLHVAILVVLLVCLCVSSGVGAFDFWHSTKQLWMAAAKRAGYFSTDKFEAVKSALMTVIMLQVMVPIALYVSLDVVKLVQAYFMQTDLSMVVEDRRLSVRTLNVAEDLGMLGQLFSDKTGTLTANRMTFRKAWVCGGTNEELSERFRPPRKPAAADDDHSMTHVVIGRESADVDGRWLKVSLAGGAGGGLVVEAAGESPVSVGERQVSTKVMWDGRRLSFPDVGVSTELPAGPEGVHSLRQLFQLAVAGGAETNIDEAAIDHAGRSWFFTCLSLCHTARPSEDGTDFQGESADEVALLREAKSYGAGLSQRASRLDEEHQHVRCPQDRLYVAHYARPWRMLGTLFFSSERRRMSVLVEEPGGTYWVISKGADSAMEASATSRSLERDWAHVSGAVEEFASRGLRTLVVACRKVPQDVAEQCEEVMVHGMGDCEVIAQLCDTLERDLALVGVTGVEDALRPGTTATVSALRQARVGIWILTGDKVGTAQHIAVVCGLVPRNGRVKTLNDTFWTRSEDEQPADRIRALGGNCDAVAMTGNRFTDFGGAGLAQLAALRHSKGGKGTEADMRHEEGKKIASALFDLSDEWGAAVMVCRATPSQKQDVVRYFRELRPNTVCAAVGDGANDVAMLRKANLGLGITGNEGRQAELASDFAIAEFSSLRQLVLVHGHWQYHRNGWTVFYFLYKSALFALVLFWFQIFSGFSQTTPIDEWSLVLFNMVYTVFPGLFVPIFDQHCPRAVLLATPQLHPGPEDGSYSVPSFLACLGDALWQSLIISFLPLLAMDQSSGGGLYQVGVMQCCAVTTTVNLVPLMDGRYQTGGTIVTCIISTLLYFPLTFLIHETSGRLTPFGYEVRNALGNGINWLTILVTVVLALYPRFLWRYRSLRIRPKAVELARTAAITGRVAFIDDDESPIN
eukprot:Hpha_TRINITY_DN12523_c0_g1::TRINITY_DN12523_c0_g1_i2::g.51194::m.51194